MEFQHELDATGLMCPEPVMMLHSKVRDIAVGEVLKVTATDPSTKRDIAKFCSFLGHVLEQQWEDETYFYFLIRKGEK
jgi:tRNA 2-thiouridine synthesizing protein A